jgi:hypothetical protein
VEREHQDTPRERFHYGAPRAEEPGPQPGADWWDEPAPPPPPPRGRLDFTALFVLLDAVRRAVPGDLQNQFTALVREALLTLRSLIDWYLERIDRPGREPEVEEIRID